MINYPLFKLCGFILLQNLYGYFCNIDIFQS